jgi:ABC-type sugar transport system ATPase subunit
VTDADGAPAVVRMEGITRRFPGVVALSGVDFDVRPGEVHVLLGENGAGKSTLIKVLSGCLPADEGRILIADQPVLMTSPRVPLERGLRFIYQELSLVPELDVARNIFLGVEPVAGRIGGVVDKGTLYRRARELLARFHLTLDPHQVVSSLSVAQGKMVEIARALVTMPRVIVMDEPTDVLEDQSRADLFDVIRRLRSDHQVGFVYISHRYQEVHELGDRVTVLRDGKRVGTYDIRQVTLDELISRMIGGQI